MPQVHCNFVTQFDIEQKSMLHDSLDSCKVQNAIVLGCKCSKYSCKFDDNVVYDLQAQRQIVQLQHELECCSVKVGLILRHLGMLASKPDHCFECHMRDGSLQRVVWHLTARQQQASTRVLNGHLT